MRSFVKFSFSCLAVGITVPAAPAMAQVVTVLHSFTGGASDGQGSGIRCSNPVRPCSG